MTVESATFISQLTASYPTASDDVSEGDDHIRRLKEVLQAQFTTLGAAAVTTTAGELNILDGVTSTTAELNLLDGVTSTTTELNLLDGVTSTPAELNILDGVTSTTAELNILDGVTSTYAELNILDGVTSTYAELNILDGVTSTYAELNILDGVTATYAELNYNDITTLGTVQNSKAVTATSGGIVNYVDKIIQSPEIRDYAESYTASSGGDQTLDLANGNVFQHTASGANVEFTFSNPPGSGKAGSLTLKWIQDSSNRTITWPTSVDWAGGSPPSVTSGSGKVDLYVFITVDGGTTWYGVQPGADLS